MKKCFPVFALLAATPLTHAQGDMQQLATQQVPADRESAKQQMIHIALEMLKHMENVTDKESADAAAIYMMNAEKTGRELGLRYGISDEEMRAALAELGYTNDYALDLFNRIEKNRYYGSETMANLMGDTLEEIETIEAVSSDDEPYTPTPQDAARAGEFADMLVQVLKLMEGISDKASADAAAANIAPLMKKVNEMSYGLAIPVEAISALCEQKGYSQSRFFAVHDAINTNRFYGSFKLAEALGASPCDVMDPIEPTPQVKAVLEPMIRQAVESLGIPVTGGPGLTEAEPWVFTQSDAPVDIATVILALPPDGFHRFAMGRTITDDGRRMESATVFYVYEEKVYEVNIYIDVTAYLNGGAH